MGDETLKAKAKLLLVDDDPGFGRFLTRAFSGQYEIQILCHGVGLESAMAEFKPDVIILDVGLPWINGYDLCGVIRRHDLYKKTPILFVSGREEFTNAITAIEVGANGYLMKPFKTDGLKKTLHTLLQEKEPTVQ